MFTKMLAKIAAPIACLALLTTSVGAQSPTSLADNGYEYNAYVYSYVAMVYADGLADVMADDGLEGDVALQISGHCNDGFFHCYDALVDDDDTQWAEAADDLELARLWCNTLSVYAQDSQPTSVLNRINSLKWYLDVAISNANNAAPARTWVRYPYFVRQAKR